MPFGSARIGTAGWTIPAQARPNFEAAGTQLERYAGGLDATEINSSFYRPHRRATYERWAASVPATFAFSLKLPKTITHVRRLENCADELARFLDESSALGEKRRVLLAQLPPSFGFDGLRAGGFFARLRTVYAGFVVCEPRHPSWFEPQADDLLREHRVGRVAADPAVCLQAETPGGDRHVEYYRLHGTPNVYYSCYDAGALGEYAARLNGSVAHERWCIFDNTAAGAALVNALELRTAIAGAERLQEHARR